MSKIDELLNKFKSIRVANLQRTKDVEAANELLEDLREAEHAAVSSGDIDAYREAKAKRIAAEEEAFVLSESAKKISDKLDPAEVKSAWQEYCSGYNKDFAKGLKRYQAARSELANLYYDMIRKQNKALSIRESCAEMLGCNRDYTGRFVLPPSLGGLQLLPDKSNNGLGLGNTQWPVDAAFFVITRELDLEERQPVFDVVRNQKSNNKISIG